MEICLGVVILLVVVGVVALVREMSIAGKAGREFKQEIGNGRMTTTEAISAYKAGERSTDIFKHRDTTANIDALLQDRRGVSIYSLRDDRGVFYIGQAVNPQARFEQHIRNAWNYDTAKNRRIMRSVDAGKLPEMDIIQVCATKMEADRVEQQQIKKHKNLTNVMHNS